MIICAESHQQFQQSANNQSDDDGIGYSVQQQRFLDNDRVIAPYL